MELAFCVANFLKVGQGGWVPLVLGGGLFAVMATWRRGRALLRERLKQAMLPLETVMAEVERMGCSRAPGTAVFMSGDPRGTPLALLHNVKHNSVLHQRNVVPTILTGDEARTDENNRLQVEPLGAGFFRVTAR